MYKLNIETGIEKKYSAIVKRKYFNRLWLVVDRKEFDTKKECKEFYRIVAAF